MAKTTKKVTSNSARKGADKLEMKGSFGANKAFEATLGEQSRQNWLEARAKFRGLDFLVKKNQDILGEGFVLEVGADGEPTAQSHKRLQEQAKVMMGANFKPRSHQSEDLGWGVARWSTSEAARAAGLDPTVEFEVGLIVSKRPNPDRAARMLDLVECGTRLQGVGMVPDQEGNHLDIPAGAALSHPGLVVVRRGEHELELTSLTNALLKARVKQWAKPTGAEKAEAKAKAKAEAEAKEEAEKAEAAYSIFDEVLADLEAEAEAAAKAEAERLEAERQAKLAEEWADVVNTRPDLVAAWEEARSEANAAHAAMQPDVDMLLGIARPEQPSREAVKRLVTKVDRETFGVIAAWVKETFSAREGLSLQDSVGEFVSFAENDMRLEALWPVLDWFVSGEPVPEAAALSEYVTRAEWLEVVEFHPGLSVASTERIKEMANSQVPT